MISEKWRSATEDEVVAEFQQVATKVDPWLTQSDLKEHDKDFAKIVQKYGGVSQIRMILFGRFLGKVQKEFDLTMTEIMADVEKINRGGSRRLKDGEKQVLPTIDGRSFWKCCKGHKFELTLRARIDAFLRGQEDCPDCIRGRYSKGEDELYKTVASLFPNEKIEKGWKPTWLKSRFGGQMHLDVALIDKKIAFEFQGGQHFKPVQKFGGEEAFKKNVQRDKDKRELCPKNGWRLIEVTYHWYNKGCSKKYIEDAIAGNYDTKIYNADLGKTCNVAYRTCKNMVLTKEGEEYFRRFWEEYARTKGIQDRVAVEQQATNIMPQTCGGGTLDVQLGSGSKEDSNKRQDQDAECDRATPSSECSQTHGTAVDVRSQQVQPAGSPEKSGSCL